MDALITNLKYNINLLYYSIKTGNPNILLKILKQHFIQYRNIYIILTYFVVIYVVYEKEIYMNITDKFKLTGGGSSSKDEGHNSDNMPSKMGESSTHASTSKHSKSTNPSHHNMSIPQGLCSGDNIISKVCNGTKNGVVSYFKFFGYILLAGLALLSPFVIYIVLVYLIIKLMLTSIQQF